MDSAYIRFHRGTHQIGGCCTELSCGGKKILIDLGSNLPGTDEECPIRDEELIRRVFDGKSKYDALLFTHYHGDHYGLYRDIPRNIPIYSDIPMYMGKTAKEIVGIVTEYTDRFAASPGGELISKIRTYTHGIPLDRDISGKIKIIPLMADHSALDAYMFYIEAAGKKILYSGDFRDHGIAGEHDAFFRMLQDNPDIPKGIDYLITEGTMLSREKETRENVVRTEAELGALAAKILFERPYNFIMVSSTNLDTIMELYHNCPDDMPFVCDIYQYRVICKAMQGRKDLLEKYAPKRLAGGKQKPVYVLNDTYSTVLGRAIDDNKEKGFFFPPVMISSQKGYKELRDGFVMLVRPNHYPKNGKNRFEEALEYFSARDEEKVRIIYSMWQGYLSGEKEDKAVTGMLAGHECIPLHVSGHAYPETILRLIKELDPEKIIPMHTEMADQMKNMEIFADYSDRITVLKDGEDVRLSEG